MSVLEFDGSEERRISCVMCREPIAYPPEMEGDEIQCPHCGEEILLLMSATVIFRRGELEADRSAYEAAMAKPAESGQDRKAESGIGQRIQVQTGKDAIPHLVEPVRLVDGPDQSVTLTHLLHPHRLVVWKRGFGVTRKPDMVAIQWAVRHEQAGRARPVPEIRLAYRFKLDTAISAMKISIADLELPFEFGTGGVEEKGATVVTGEIPDDRFLPLCSGLAKDELLQISFPDTDIGLAEKSSGKFREYTLEFYEALRRRFGYFFK